MATAPTVNNIALSYTGVNGQVIAPTIDANSFVPISGDTKAWQFSVSGIRGQGSISIGVAAGSLTDDNGNTNAALSASLPYSQVISLGTGKGQLINGVQVAGSWYYIWDRNGDGRITTDSATSSDLALYTDVQSLLLGRAPSNTNVGGTNDLTVTSGVVNGINLSIPALGLNALNPQPALTASNGFQDYLTGTSRALSGLLINTSGTDTGNTINSTFTGLASIWDAFNGTDTIKGTDSGPDGTPPGWTAGSDTLTAFWTSTDLVAPTAANEPTLTNTGSSWYGNKYSIDLSNGFITPTLVTGIPSDPDTIYENLVIFRVS